MRAASPQADWRPKLCFVATYFLLSCAVASRGATLSFTFRDAAGDPRDNFDLTELDFRFDNQTGDYSIKATADPANPFTDSHLLYLSVFNPDVGTTERDRSFFSVGRFSFSTTSPTTMLERGGNSPVLTYWKAGDRVASYDVLGVPDGIIDFHSVMGGTTHSFSNSDEILDQAVIVPEPSCCLLTMLGASIILFDPTRRRGKF